MFQVGLTGGIGSGKTLVCSVLEKLGVAVYYADREARRLMVQDSYLVSQIVELFGVGAYRGEDLNREFIAKIAFGDTNKLKELNTLVHPAVRKDYSQWVEMQTESPYVVEEAAILFESGADRYLNFTVLVYAPIDLRIQRVIQRDQVGKEEVLMRIGQQMDEEEKRRLADHVICNDEQEMLLPQIIQLHRNILERR